MQVRNKHSDIENDLVGTVVGRRDIVFDLLVAWGREQFEPLPLNLLQYDGSYLYRHWQPSGMSIPIMDLGTGMMTVDWFLIVQCRFF